MWWESFRVTSAAVAQIFLIAAIGFVLVKRNFLGPEGLKVLCRLVIEITLPLLIFCQLVKDFRFDLYPKWWIFPLLSLGITLVGLAVGLVFIGLIKGQQKKLQFLSLVAFQNSGYLPLALADVLLPPGQRSTMFIYIFLFLLGFNLLMWSLGVYMLTFSRAKRFELGSLFSPPVIATLCSLTFIFFGGYKFMPEAVLRPLRMVGDCTLPLAMLVVGGSLAQINLGRIDKKAIFFIILAKIVILPALGLWLVLKFNLPELLGLLILMQFAVPPATSTALIMQHYKKEDLLISQGIFFGHLLGLVSLPIFLSLYFTLFMVR